MMTWLHNNFPMGKNYLVCQQHQEQINSFFFEHLIAPFQLNRKHNLWGEVAEKLPRIGRKLDWVPNKISAIFLNKHVELEIADALALPGNYFQPCPSHFQAVKNLLNQFKFEHLVHRNLLFLSDGETKILWFLIQWVKKPEYLILGYLPSGFSRQRINAIVNFMIEISRNHDSYPVIILGFLPDDMDWYEPLYYCILIIMIIINLGGIFILK